MKKLALLIIPLTILFQGCEKSHQNADSPDNIPDSLVQWNILRVEGPSTALRFQKVTLKVYYPTSSGCDYVSKLVPVLDNKTVLIKAYGGTIRNAYCSLAAVPKTIDYEFTPVETGQFLFKFVNRDNSFITHTLTVN